MIPHRERSLSIYASLEPGTYMLLAATFLPGMEGLFNIKIISNWSLILDQQWPPLAKEATFAEKLMARTLRYALHVCTLLACPADGLTD